MGTSYLFSLFLFLANANLGCLAACRHYFRKPVDLNKIVEDSDLQVVTPSCHPQPIDPSDDIQINDLLTLLL